MKKRRPMKNVETDIEDTSMPVDFIKIKARKLIFEKPVILLHLALPCGSVLCHHNLSRPIYYKKSPAERISASYRGFVCGLK